ncbi:MAG TPA: tetratricopeptide repeat protein, partial [Clostridia bacterium]|nr:tetratricopeptide repeat protein [Clostridia bacterium]
DENLAEEADTSKDDIGEKADSEQAETNAGADEAEESEDIEDTDDLDESERCLRCGKRRRDTSVAQDYEFCDRCRGEMMAAPIKWQGFVAAICAIIIAGVAFVMAAFTSVVALPVLEAKSFEKENRLSDALNSYYMAQDEAEKLNEDLKMENLFSAGTKTFVKQMQLTAKVQSPLSVGQVLSTSVKDEKAYKSLWLRKLKPYNDTFIKFQNTQEAVQPIVADYQETQPKDVPYDELIAQLEALKTSEDAAKYESYFIEYYKTYVAVLADKGPQAELDHMLAVKKIAPEQTWLFNLYIADCYNRLEKYDEMIAVCDEIIEENANSVQAYSLKARVYCQNKEFDKAIAVSEQMEKYNPDNAAVFALSAEIYRRKGDIEKAASICAEGLEKVPGGGTELYRQQAIVLLLKGDKKAAYEAANSAYNSAYYNQDTTLELINTVALCASLAEETEMYEETVNFLEQNGAELAQSVSQIIEGTKTLQEVFIDGKGDVL